MNKQRFPFASTMAASLLAMVFLAPLTLLADNSSRSSVDKTYLLDKAPLHAKEVAAIRKQAKDQDEVVVVGRIGGRKTPMLKGMAAFSIVDRSLKACNERPGDTCPTPWDFCCEADVSKNTVLVLVQESDGKIVKKDARELLGLKELDTVYVQGKAKRDKAGNVSILASKIYVADANASKNAAGPDKKEVPK
jgi:hypothetical protein